MEDLEMIRHTSLTDVLLLLFVGYSHAEVPAKLMSKIKDIQQRTPTWINSGGDPASIAPLGAQLNKHIQAGQFDDAEKVASQIIAIIEGRSPAATGANKPGDRQQQVRSKVERIMAAAPGWISNGGDESTFRSLSSKLDAALKRGNLGAADATADELLKLVAAAPATPATGDSAAAAPAGAKSSDRRHVATNRVPSGAEIVYHFSNNAYVTDSGGRTRTLIVSAGLRHLEHVAVSYDRTKVVADYFKRPREGGMSPALILWDLEAGTETDLLANFEMAGNGGVAWDKNGFIYFAGIQARPYPQPKSREQFIANAGANDVWRVKWDGTGLQRLTQTSDRGEADVSTSLDGKYITYMATKIDPPNDYTEIWMRNSDGMEPRLVYKGGKSGVASVHDP
jgi:hypothetical protein